MYQPLKGSDLYDLTAKLLLGFRMDNILFYQLLSSAQSNIENYRPWMILRKEDSSLNVYPQGNLYLTPLDLPSDFRRFYSSNRSVVLVSPDKSVFRFYKQIPMERRHEYKDDNTKFYVDYANKKLYLCGTLDRAYEVHLFYIKETEPVTEDTSWVFPPEYHPILAYNVAMAYKTGFDYDIVNDAQAKNISGLAQTILKQMEEWDNSLQVESIEGLDYPDDSSRPTFYSNTIGYRY